ncbi:MAG: hypothetical protein ACI8X5_004004 [Planctomycetota bacterium]
MFNLGNGPHFCPSTWATPFDLLRLVIAPSSTTGPERPTSVPAWTTFGYLTCLVDGYHGSSGRAQSLTQPQPAPFQNLAPAGSESRSMQASTPRPSAKRTRPDPRSPHSRRPPAIDQSPTKSVNAERRASWQIRTIGPARNRGAVRTESIRTLARELSRSRLTRMI